MSRLSLPGGMSPNGMSREWLGNRSSTNVPSQYSTGVKKEGPGGMLAVTKLAEVETGNALAEGAEHVGGNRAKLAGHVGGILRGVAICPVNRGDIA